MAGKLPDGHGDAAAEGGRTVVIENLHLQVNDLDALRRLSEQDPELARAVVQQKDNEDRREHASFRFGVITAAVLALGLVFAATYALVELGIALSLLLVFLVMALALLMRVLITGEWSETSWVGALTNGIVKVLGGKPKNND